MKRDDYERMGGHDENIFIALEDIDFSYRIRRKGFQLKKISMPYRHFVGMSTVILLSERPSAVKLLFGYCLLPQKTITKWKGILLGLPELKKFEQMGIESRLYLLSKQKLPPNSELLVDTTARKSTLQSYPALSQAKEIYENWVRRRLLG
jgi:GT2 family glycosyltransferase